MLHQGAPRHLRLVFLGLAALLGSCQSVRRVGVSDGDRYVFDWLCPGVCAMSPSDATALVGARVTFSSSFLQFGERRCVNPTYRVERQTSQTFAEGLRTTPERLSLTSSDVELMYVSCDGIPWWGPGSVIVRESRRLMTLWDGVIWNLVP
jgi:hypothetical protein